MIGSTARQASLFYFAFAKEVMALTDDVLDPLDSLLEDAQLVQLATQALAKRPSIAPDRLLRCLVLKHLKNWSFRVLERELRASLLYRRFTRFFEDPTPDFTSFSRTFGLFGKEGTAQIHARVVQLAKEQGLAKGARLRTDTTAVESNIHHPTDSSLLADGLRVLTRSLKRIGAGCQAEALKVVDHHRAAKRRVLEICRAAKTLSDAGQQRLKTAYGKLLALSRRVVKQTTTVLADLTNNQLVAQADQLVTVLAAQAQLRHYLPLVQKVIAQTQARIFEGQTHYPDKILSLFEEHTVVIRKGKAHKPNEFGRLVRLDEVENGIVSCYHIAATNQADQQQWQPALEQHVAIFERTPYLAAADRGFCGRQTDRPASTRPTEPKPPGTSKGALVPARSRLARGRRGPHQHPQARLRHGASLLQRRHRF
jgi:transposase, IS5 family